MTGESDLVGDGGGGEGGGGQGDDLLLAIPPDEDCPSQSRCIFTFVFVAIEQIRKNSFDVKLKRLFALREKNLWPRRL